MGRLGAVLRAPGAVLKRRKLEMAITRKTLKNIMNIYCFCLFGPSWGSSWSALGASLGPLGPSWGHLGRLGALLGCLGTLLGASWGPLGPSWGPLASEKSMRPSPGARKSAQEIWKSGAPAPRILEPQSPEYRQQRTFESLGVTPPRSSRHVGGLIRYI